MKFQDYYELLGVPRDADAKAIKKAYRKLAMKWHPDRHQGDAATEAEARFKQISEAYEVLSDPEKRGKYDRFGEHWKHGQDFAPGAGESTMSHEEFEAAFGSGGGFSDFFQQAFGREYSRDFGGRRPAHHGRFDYRGADVSADLSLPIGDALAGGKRRFSVPGAAACETCGGTGFLEQHVCPTCGGVGRVHMTKTVDLTLPAAPRDGLRLRLDGLGEPGHGGGEPGDLLLTLRLADDDAYRIVGARLEARLVLAPWEAEAGAKVDLRTAKGVATVTVPAGTRAGRRMRLRGQGLTDASGAAGDCIVRIEIDLPAALTDEQRELLARLGESAQAAGTTVRGGARTGDPS